MGHLLAIAMHHPNITQSLVNWTKHAHWALGSELVMMLNVIGAALAYRMRGSYHLLFD